MKEIGKITLAKAYDVLSENEMKHVVGGMGSGSGIGAMYTCSYTWYKDDGTPVDERLGMVYAKDENHAVSLICEKSTIANCSAVATCV